MITFDDVLVFALASNLNKGKVWANYQCLKDFFAGLKGEELDWSAGDVRRCIEDLHISPGIDHAMTRVLPRFSYVVESGDDYLRMNELVQNHTIADIWKSASPEDRAALKEIAGRYGELLIEIGR